MNVRNVLALAVVALFALPASADLITVDEITYPTTAADPSKYDGTVDMTYDSVANELTIVLTNTSTGAVGGSDTADNLLTGLGFNLGGSLYITGGTATITAGSTAVGFVDVLGGDVSQEWGYDTDPLASGAFTNTNLVTGSYTEAVSSMESQSTSQFATGSIAPPVNQNGPDFGLLSTTVSGGILGSGVEAIQSSVTIVLSLGGTYSGDLLAYIESHDVALSFGSPTAPNGSVPEPGMLALCALAVGGAFGLRRKRSR
ncbi:MAG: XDD4 family exosortase-dependent surface protein [Planctomycetota bacterium]|jgi:hypothetical protein